MKSELNGDCGAESVFDSSDLLWTKGSTTDAQSDGIMEECSVMECLLKS